jgi:hypothetical protein
VPRTQPSFSPGLLFFVADFGNNHRRLSPSRRRNIYEIGYSKRIGVLKERMATNNQEQDLREEGMENAAPHPRANRVSSVIWHRSVGEPGNFDADVDWASRLYTYRSESSKHATVPTAACSTVQVDN